MQLVPIGLETLLDIDDPCQDAVQIAGFVELAQETFFVGLVLFLGGLAGLVEVIGGQRHGRLIGHQRWPAAALLPWLVGRKSQHRDRALGLLAEAHLDVGVLFVLLR